MLAEVNGLDGMYRVGWSGGTVGMAASTSADVRYWEAEYKPKIEGVKNARG
jgi:hypothetical protein